MATGRPGSSPTPLCFKLIQRRTFVPARWNYRSSAHNHHRPHHRRFHQSRHTALAAQAPLSRIVIARKIILILPETLPLPRLRVIAAIPPPRPPADLFARAKSQDTAASDDRAANYLAGKGRCDNKSEKAIGSVLRLLFA